MSNVRSNIRCRPRLELTALEGVPVVQPGDDLGALLCEAVARAGLALAPSDVLVVTSKVISRAQDRFVDLASVVPSSKAEALAARTQKDPRHVELILREASAISRTAPGVIVVRHRLGFVSANAGIDESNGRPASVGRGPWVLLLPEDPDRAARELRGALRARFGVEVGVLVTDSHGRPFRVGTVGVAIGIAGLPALWDQRGAKDLHGRRLEATTTALADQVATAADLVAGQADEGRPFVHVRGLEFPAIEDASARELLRNEAQDLYA